MRVSREYIAGLFDGEGSISLIKARCRKGGQVLRPEVTITQKQTWLLEIVSASLASYGVGCHLSTRSYNGVARLMIAGMKRTRRFIDEIGPFVVLKQAQLQVVAQFIAKRLSMPPNTPYDGEDWLAPGQILNLRNTRQAILRDLTGGSPPGEPEGDGKVQTATTSFGG